MVLTRAHIAEELARKIFDRTFAHTVNESTGSPVKLESSNLTSDAEMEADVDAEMAHADLPHDMDRPNDTDMPNDIREEFEDADDFEGADDFADADGEDDEAPDSDSEASSPCSRRWPPTIEDTRGSARKMREKLAQLALERKLRESTSSNDQDDLSTAAIEASCDLDPFASVTTSGFDFAKSLDNTDGPGMVGVFVEEDSFSKGGEAGDMWKEWQVQRQQRSSPTYDANRETELTTMGLLGRLPGELRNRIYRLVLVMDEAVPYPFTMSAETCALGACVHANLDTGLPGLLSTCRQLRGEGLPIFLAENTGFTFDARMVESRCVANFIRALGFSARLIKRVVLEFVVYKPYNGTVTSEITLTCPSGHVLAGKEGLAVESKKKGFVLEVGKEVREKADGQVKKVQKHVKEMNAEVWKSYGWEVEEAMEALVGSDWMADVVWKCRK